MVPPLISARDGPAPAATVSSPLDDPPRLPSAGYEDGNRHARRVLIEAAKACRHRAKVSEQMRARPQELAPALCDITWRAQVRLRPLPRLLASGKAPEHRYRRRRPRAGRVHVGHREASATRRIEVHE